MSRKETIGAFCLSAALLCSACSTAPTLQAPASSFSSSRPSVNLTPPPASLTNAVEIFNGSWDKPWVVAEPNRTVHVFLYDPGHVPGMERGPVVQLFRDETNRVFANLSYDQRPDRRISFPITISFLAAPNTPPLLQVTFPFNVPKGCPNQTVANPPILIGPADPQVLSAIRFASYDWPAGAHFAYCND